MPSKTYQSAPTIDIIIARHKNVNLTFIFLLSITICLLTTQKLALSVNPVLNLKEEFPYLISKIDGKTIEPRDYMDFDNIYEPNATYKWNQTAQGRNYHLLKAFDFANYYQSDFWHYSDEADLLVSAHPVADANRCAQHLDWLERQLNTSETLFHRGQEHINFASLIDAFGRPVAGTHLGHSHWLGSYYECKKVSINIQRFELEEKVCGQRNGGCKFVPITNISDGVGAASANGGQEGGLALLKARYCIGKARDLDWPDELEDNYVPRISYKVGLCLPESCETVSFQRHRAQIERLMRFNMPTYLRSRINLNDMYCLPDERSPIRRFSLSAKIFLAICSTWLILSLVATWLYSNYSRQFEQLTLVRSEKTKANTSLRLEATGDRQQVVLKLSGTCKQDNDNNNNIINAEREPERVSHKNRDPEYHRHLVFAPPEVMAEANAHSNGSPLLAIETKVAGALPSQTSPNNNGRNDPRASTNEPPENNNEDKSIQDEHRQSRSHLLSAFCCRLNNSSSSPAPPQLLISILRAMSIRVNLVEFHRVPLLLNKLDGEKDENSNSNNNKRLRINLNGLDFIKCLCCLLVIFGHIVFVHIQHLSNIPYIMEQAKGLTPTILIAFFNFVDTFFIISGLLTAYFIFKRFTLRSFGHPRVWFSVSMLRLLRLSPVYILTFWFAKTLTVHLSEGPIWDYGTDRHSIKGLCVHDHWWKSLLYLGNLNTMQPLCILPAWSIILDAQYSIILPPIIYLIFKDRRLGYASLLLGILISTTNMSLQLASQTAVKTGHMATIKLHVYPLISRFAAEFYNTPWNRLGPVAIGVMGGHMLYLYDVGKIRQWPWFMTGWTFKLNLLMHLTILSLPTIGLYAGGGGQQTEPSSSPAQDDITMFVISNATIKPIWSLINTIFLLRLVTDLSDCKSVFLCKLMSKNIWHCMGKLCFTAYLIHYEIIMIFLKSRREGLIDLNWWNFIREFSCVLLVSIVVAFLVYILFEAPINKLIMLSINKPTNYTIIVNRHHEDKTAIETKNGKSNQPERAKRA